MHTTDPESAAAIITAAAVSTAVIYRMVDGKPLVGFALPTNEHHDTTAIYRIRQCVEGTAQLTRRVFRHYIEEPCSTYRAPFFADLWQPHRR